MKQHVAKATSDVLGANSLGHLWALTFLTSLLAAQVLLLETLP